MAKRPTSRSQGDDTGAAAPDANRQPRPRAPRRSAPEPPGAPVPSDAHAARAEANDERSISADPGPRRETPNAVTPESSSATRQPSDEDIRVRAYQRYLERGGSHGMEFDDWVEAEKELKTGR
jgi:hypothetical protein